VIRYKLKVMWIICTNKHTSFKARNQSTPPASRCQGLGLPYICYQLPGAAFWSADIFEIPSLNSTSPQNMADSSNWALDIKGNFPLHKAVIEVILSRTKVVSSELCGVSAWTKTAKVSVILLDGSTKNYFLKVRLCEL